MLTAPLRTRRAGDYLIVNAQGGRKKLKDYFISKGIDQPFRDGWPLLCLGQEVLWVIGVGASERLRYRPDADYQVFVIHYSGRLPDQL